MIFQKRSEWCFKDENGRTHRFSTEAEAKLAFNGISVQEPVLEEDELEEYDESEDA